ncbi:Rab GDP-dissociation inhibitor isoform 2 [Galdieria sulphuraria]|uniref:Rab GDP dissociation inhibitor n=1 Tax=Galdieria sulphuraria TaxID=130081 RepID=M2W5Z5_GALSU|nr:Rab GDP-dissociation inhibitor isoform 2 [Galdieria sulphuraria]EME31191.1 Rab GDP-dissociation inhibitor isoform 2 [Galdieria sulphuraria]|eukprot:XP_005707711.1 Rab GDP-dissociation inhibitor isoform 2 [Galdieria sulphuraria]
MDSSQIETGVSSISIDEKPTSKKLADGNYDVVVLGTGLTECILSGIFSVSGYKVLHMDRNSYYGGACASLSLNQLYEKLKSDSEPDSAKLGRSRDYNIDLIPKFILSSGNLVRILTCTQVTKYLEFKLVDGSFVVHGGKPHKVPVTPREAMTSGLMSLLEKNRCRQFFSYVQDVAVGDPGTFGSLDLKNNTMRQVFEYFGLRQETIDFIGHALALYKDDSYLELPALPTIERIQLYANSLARYGHSPYIYPLYGLGELPQAFARLSAVYGGTYMLNRGVDKIDYNPEGKVCGVYSNEEYASCRFIVADPSYFPEKAKPVGKVIRCYCILREAPPHTKDASSCQIIIPHRQVSPPRRSNIYVLVLSYNHRVCPQGFYIALVSTTVETNQPKDEVTPGIQLLGNSVLEKFYSVDDIYEPLESSHQDNIFLSKSYDATTHFESTMDDVFEIYEKVGG